MPRVSATSRSRTRSSNRTRNAESNSARASASGRPSTASFGNPSSSSPGSRVTNTSATDSANSRRATNASACADERSSHCASSTTHKSGCSCATSASRLSTANPTRNRSGGAPTRCPNATPSASRCGAGSRSSRSSRGAHNCCNAANASSISDSTPPARRTRNPDADSIADSTSADLPTPGSPHITSTRLCPPHTPCSSRPSISRSRRRSCNPSAGPSVTMLQRRYRGRVVMTMKFSVADYASRDSISPGLLRLSMSNRVPRSTPERDCSLPRGRGSKRSRLRELRWQR